MHQTGPRQTRHKPEFKFSKCSDKVRDGFFESVVACPFHGRALVVQKELAHSMQHDNGVLKNAKVRIDGSGDWEFQRG